MKGKLKSILTILMAFMIISGCKAHKPDRMEIERMLDYLWAYPTFKIRLIDIKENEIVLERPYEKGRIVPVPGVWNDYLNTYEWIDASKLLDQYFDKIKKIIKCTQGVDKVTWYVDTSEVLSLYNFKDPAYTTFHFLASLIYGDTLGFRECFSDSLIKVFDKNGTNIFRLMQEKIKPNNKFIQMGAVNDSIFVCPLPDSTKKLLLYLNVENSQWKISLFHEKSIND